MSPTGPIIWKLIEIAFIRAASTAQLSMDTIRAQFAARFPQHRVTAASVTYCISQYIDREEFNPDIWLAGFPGKKGYLLGLVKRKVQPDEIIRRIEHRYPSHRWPGTDRANHKITKREAVEIAVATYHEYAPYYGRTSLFVRYPNQNEPTAQEVLGWYRQDFSPDVIRHSRVPPMDYDDVIFILTCFAPGFADSYLSDPQVVGSVMLPGGDPAPSA